jgi:hypothetical protein
MQLELQFHLELLDPEGGQHTFLNSHTEELHKVSRADVVRVFKGGFGSISAFRDRQQLILMRHVRWPSPYTILFGLRIRPAQNHREIKLGLLAFHHCGQADD